MHINQLPRNIYGGSCPLLLLYPKYFATHNTDQHTQQERCKQTTLLAEHRFVAKIATILTTVGMKSVQAGTWSLTTVNYNLLALYLKPSPKTLSCAVL